MVNRPNPAGISSAVVSNLERRTTTLGSIVPRLGPCFQRWLLVSIRKLNIETQHATSLAKMKSIFAGGEDMGYFDCYSGGRGFESRRRRCS